MNDTFLLYLLTRVDAVGTTLCASGGVGLVVLAFSCFMAVPFFDLETDKIRDFIRSLKWKFISCIALIFVGVFIPSRNDVIFIFGGTAVLEAVRSDRAKSIGTKTLDVIEGYLDDAAKKGAK